MCGYKRSDRIGNKVIRNKINVAPIDDKMRETRLAWFGHDKRMNTNAHVRRE